MPTRDIKTRIVLEGEQEYKRAISDAAAANKVLNSELKLAKAQFEATGDAEEYAAEQARILKEKIAEQKKAVEAAEEAVRKLTEKGIDKNSTQMQKWKEKLNNAKASLYQMQSRLDKVGTELGQEQTEFDKTKQAGTEFDDKLQEIAKGVSFQNTITAIDGITGTIEKVVKAAARAAKAVWEMGVDAGTWADDISTKASEMGVDPETYQSWLYASRFIDTSVEDIKKSWNDIDNGLQKNGDSFYEYLDKLNAVGVGFQDLDGKTRQGKDIFWDVIDSLHNMGDESAYAAKAAQFFGNDWRRLNPLIEAGSKAYKDMAEEGKSVAVVSNENVKALAGVDDEVQKFQASFEKMKLDTLAALAPTFQTVAQALTQAVQAFDTFVQSEEGQQALAGLNEALQGIIKSFLGEDNGQGTFKAIVEGAKGAVEGFTGAMEWISKNAGTVTDLVKGLGAAWATLKVTKGVLQFMQLLKAIPTESLKAIFGGGKAKAAELPETANKFGSNTPDAASRAAKESAERSAAAAESAGKASSDSSAASSGSADASGKASSKSAADSGKASSDAASKSASSSSGSAKSASDASSSSSKASSGSAKSASDASSSSSKASSGSAKSAADASSSSSTASSGSAASAADASSSSSAASSASAAGASDAAITSAGASSQAALESGTASSQAAITSGSASSQAAITSGSASSQAAITSGNASSQAAITSGSASSQAAITSGSASSQAAIESGAASSQAAITSGSASSASAASAAQAAITSAKASQAAAEAAAARSMLPSGSNLLGSGDSWIKKFLPSGISIRPTVSLGGGNTGGYLPAGPQFPALPSGTPAASGGAAFSILENALTLFSSTAAKVGGGLGLGLAMAFKETKTGNNDIWDELGNPTAEALSAGITWRQEEQEKYNDQLAITQQKQEEILKLTEEQRAAAEAYWDRYRADDGDTNKDAEAAANLKKAFEGDLEGMDQLIDMMDGRLDFYEKMNQEIPENLPDEWFSAGQNAAEKLEEAIAKATPEVITAGQDMGTAAVDAADKSLEAMKTAGDNASIGMAIGIDRSAHYAMEAANRLAAAVAGCAQRTLAIQSPSKVMSRLGKFTSLGFAQGIESGAADVDRAVSHMLSATTRRPVTAMGGVPITGRTVAGSAGSRAGSAAPDTVHVTLTMDDEVVGDIMAPIINAKIGAQIQATSRN